MKNSKYCHMMACCWGWRHELLGLILLIIATFLTIITCNSFGIVAMFLVGGALCYYKHLCCHAHHGDMHCRADSECSGMDNVDKESVKKAVVKTKK